VTPQDTPPTTPPGGGPPELSPHDEQALIQRCVSGDVAAFEPLVEKYRQRVWRLAYQVLHDREDAWDCAQEAFVRAFHSLPSFRGQSAFYTWLFRITVNLATDRHRARGAQARAFGAERVPEEEWERTTADPGARPDQAAARVEQRARIRQALDALPPKARTIIMLSDVEGLSYREIAEVLNCPIGTVMSRLHNARKRLKALLGPMLALLLWLVFFVSFHSHGGTGLESAQRPLRDALASSSSTSRLVSLEADRCHQAKPSFSSSRPTLRPSCSNTSADTRPCLSRVSPRTITSRLPA